MCRMLSLTRIACFICVSSLGRARAIRKQALRPEDPLMRAMEQLPRFYVYNDIDWMGMTCDGFPISNILNDTHKDFRKDIAKHSDDYWFLKHALEHRSRTHLPDEAKIFVVGGLNNILVEQRAWSGLRCCAKLTVRGPVAHPQAKELCGDDLVALHKSMLNESSWFHRNQGADHVVVLSHYAGGDPFFHKFHKITFEQNFEEPMQNQSRKLCRVASTYVGHGCRPVSKKLFDVAFIASLHANRSTFQPRRDLCRFLNGSGDVSQTAGFLRKMCDWLQLDWVCHLSKHPSVAACGEAMECPALAQSRFTVHVRGDTWGSQRPIDALVSGTEVIFTSEKQYEILPPFLPWRNMTRLLPVELDVASTTDIEFQKAMDTILTREYGPLVEFNKRYNTYEILDWTKPHLFERYMKYFAEQCIE